MRLAIVEYGPTVADQDRPSVLRKTMICDVAIVGGGPAAESLKQLTVDLGIEDRVEFLGSMDTEGVIRELARASIFASAPIYFLFFMMT